MQSYGGIAGSEAVPGSLTYSTCHSQGLPGGVIHLFYYVAMLLGEGQSMLSAFGDSRLNKIEPDGRGYFLNAAKVIYNDLPEAEAQMWEERLLPAPYEIQKTKTTTAAWKYVESTYLVCENDQAVPVQFQEMFAGLAKSRVVRCSAGHSPMLSQTSVLADEIAEAAERAIEKLD
jgi:pimeloyl-ACP methyl ester carboxylesterase